MAINNTDYTDNSGIIIVSVVDQHLVLRLLLVYTRDTSQYCRLPMLAIFACIFSVRLSYSLIFTFLQSSSYKQVVI